MNRIPRLFGRLGIDRAIGYSSLARIVQGLAGIVAILFVARYLSLEEQGFYFTFASLTALQMFFELGLNGIIVQYVAHEASHLKQEGDAWIGPELHRSRMASLLHFCLRWYTAITLLFFVTLLVLGYFFFASTPDTRHIDWQGPWVFILLGVSVNLFLAAFLSYLEGLGKVKEVAKIRFVQQLCASLVLLVGLWAGMGLYVTGMNLVLGALVVSVLLLKNYKTLFLYLYRCPITARIRYFSEIFPYQWKVAVSWMSGYLIIQLFNPILFRLQGPAVAGKMGMTLTVFLTIQALALTWIYTKVPVFSGLIAQKRYQELNALFARTHRQSLFVTASLLGIALAGIAGLRIFGWTILGTNLAERFLPIREMCILALGIFLFTMVFSWASFLRCHKQEPMLPQAITAGLLCPVLALVLAYAYGSMGAGLAYLTVAAVSAFMGKWIFEKKRKEWHQTDKT